MNKENFMAIVADLRIDNIISFNINYKEYNLQEEPTKTIKLEENYNE